MNFFTVVSLFGGLALFLYGMHEMSAGLEKFSGGALERTLQKFTSNIFKGVLFGLVVTALIQSSSATTVLIVGLVNAGIIKLKQAVGILMGANIGTTVTGQITRLLDLDAAGNPILEFFKPSTLAPLVAVIGIILIMFCKGKNQKIIGQIAMGFGVLFTGLLNMSASVEPLKDNPVFLGILEKFSAFPILGLLAGIVITAIIQSSSASVGMLQALSSTGALTFGSTYPIILGQNIGTCVTSLISSIGANKNAKRTAAVHIYFNVIGTLIFLVAMTILHMLGVFDGIWNQAMSSGDIANFHTVFNIVTTLLLLPFASALEKLAVVTIKDKPSEEDEDEVATGLEGLDDRFLVSPTLALNHCSTIVGNMGKKSLKNFHASIKQIREYDPKKIERIQERENTIDMMEDSLGNYMVKLADCELSDDDNKQLTYLLHIISEFERIGDYSINLVEQATILNDKKIKFSENAQTELKVLASAVEEIITLSLQTYEQMDLVAAVRVEPLEETIDSIQEILKSRHIERLKTGLCTVDTGVIYLDLLTNLERISDHCSNIAVYTIGAHLGKSEINRHEYIQKIHNSKEGSYVSDMQYFYQKYTALIEQEESF